MPTSSVVAPAWGSERGAGDGPHAFPRPPEQAATEIADLIHQSPRQHGLALTRWTLASVGQQIAWLAERSLATVCRTLQRFDVHYRRGRHYLHSPDWYYEQKAGRVEQIVWYSRLESQRYVVLYGDELTYYRRATIGYDYVLGGEDGPRAEQGLHSNTARRIAGCLDAITGQLFAWQRAHFDRHTLIRFFAEVAAAYPQAERITIVLDNWPVHFHPDVLRAAAELRLWLVDLPTYSPWLNPIEKVWRKLYQEVLHLHRWSMHWEQLQQAVQAWLDQYRRPAPDLLRYVGLSRFNC
jgi:DDE superfamily endonuclease